MKQLKSYICSLDGIHWTPFNTYSPGNAKSTYLRSLDMDIKYTSILCKVYGKPVTSEDFIKNAKYRGIEFAYCGMRVTVGEMNGFIVGHNSSANLDVLFIDGKYKNQTLNCHPNHNITYFDKNDNVIKQY